MPIPNAAPADGAFWRGSAGGGTLAAVSPPDVALMSRIREGDESAVAVLYDRHAAPLLALAYRLLGDRSDAEDVVLEALARVWREASRFDHTRGSLRAWLTVMVRSRALDAIRARRRSERLTADAARGNPEDVAGVSMSAGQSGDPAEQDEQRRRVVAALAELPGPQREAIELAYYGGLSQSEIAERLGTPLGTVKTRIRDGMQKLRITLKPLYAGGVS
jgi:RNA polymerase sigma-70 factor (ECF subfamily)